MSWMTNTLQATSGLLRDSVLERMKDTSIIPLHIACDVVIGEHAQYADYIVPDTNPFESFGVVTNEGFFKSKGNSVRWPAKTPRPSRSRAVAMQASRRSAATLPRCATCPASATTP